MTHASQHTSPDPVTAQRAHKPFLSKYWYSLLLLASLALLAYGGAARTPSLLGDEWWIMGDYVFSGGPRCPDWQTARPFGPCWSWLVHHTLGVNMHANHAAAILMNLVVAVLLLAALDQFLPGWPSFNMAAAAIFLVFPGDVTRTWLGGNIAYGAAPYFVTACFLAAFYRRGRWWMWLVGMLALLFALGTYEVGIGLVLALSLLAVAFANHLPWPKRLAFLAPALVAVLFSLWRWRVQVESGPAYGHSAENAVFSPLILLARLAFGVRYNLQQAWADTVSGILSSILPVEGPTGPWTANMILVCLALLPFGLIYLGMRLSWSSPPLTEDDLLIRTKIATMAKAMGVGLVMLCAGFFPIIIAVAPRAEYVDSRVNFLPGVGAAIVICALLFMAALFFGRRPCQARMLVLAGLIPLLGLAVATHLLVQRETRQAWADQKLIWQSLFEQAPDIVDGTHIVILLNEYDIPPKGPRPILSGNQGMNNVIRLLYGKETLFAHYGYAWPPRVLSADGEYLVYTDHGVRQYLATETLVFVFGRNDRQLVRIPEIESNGQALPLGPDRIIDRPTQATQFRWLVSGE